MIVSQYESICLSIRDSKMEGVTIKILGRATLTVFKTSKVDPVTIFKSRQTIIFEISG